MSTNKCKKMKHHLHKLLNNSKTSKFWNTDSPKKLWEDTVKSANHWPTKCSKKLRKDVANLAKRLPTDSSEKLWNDLVNSAKRAVSCFSPCDCSDHIRKLEELTERCEEIAASMEKHSAKEFETVRVMRSKPSRAEDSECFYDCSEFMTEDQLCT